MFLLALNSLAKLDVLVIWRLKYSPPPHTPHDTNWNWSPELMRNMITKRRLLWQALDELVGCIKRLARTDAEFTIKLEVNAHTNSLNTLDHLKICDQVGVFF